MPKKPTPLMRGTFSLVLSLSFLLCAVIVTKTAPAQEQGQSQTKPQRVENVRELFVPELQLGQLLENCADRTIMTRDEYEKLLREADRLKAEEEAKIKANDPGAKAPVDYLAIASEYKISVVGERALIEGELEIESFTDRLIGIPLSPSNISLRGALLDDKPARIGGTLENESLRLFLKGKGKHRLKLSMTTPLAVDSTRQELRFRLPRSPQMNMFLEVPGDVDLKSGPAVVSRKVEGEGLDRKTKFELLANSDLFHLLMSLNSHKMREIRTVLVRSVQFDELTETYERLHATFSLEVLHQGVDRFRISVPKGFDVTEARSPEMARWVIDSEKNELEIIFREPLTGKSRLEIAALRNYTDGLNSLENWTFPLFAPLETSSNIAGIGLLLDSRVEIGEIRAEKLIPIDTAQLAAAIPGSVLEAAPGAPSLRFVSAWYAPQGKWNVAAKFTRPEAGLESITHLVLNLDERKQSLKGSFLISPKAEKLFEFMIRVPDEWMISKVSDANDTPIDFETKKIDELDYVRVRLPRGIAPGETFRVLFEANGLAEGWIGNWDEISFEFPAFLIKDAKNDNGTLAISADDDMTVVPKDAVRLMPLDEKEKNRLIPGLGAKLAYRYLSQPYGLSLTIQHPKPRAKARTFSFYKISPSLLLAHYELDYEIEEARAKELVFLLPGDTSETPGIYGLDGLRIKEYNQEPLELEGKTFRKWTVSLAEPARGKVRIAVDLEKRISEGDTEKRETIELPAVRAENVAWQAGLIAIEGHEELNIEVPEGQSLRSVDIGELAAADYVPGRRLLGVYNITGTDSPEKAPLNAKIEMLRNPAYALPPSIVRDALVHAMIGRDGNILYSVDYQLKTKATFIMIDLKENEKLWSVTLEGTLLRPQRNGSRLMIDIPARSEDATRSLRLIYGTKNTDSVDPNECKLCSVLDSESAPSPQPVVRKVGRFAYDAYVRLPELLIPKRSPEGGKIENAENVENGAKKAGDNWEKIPVARLQWAIETPSGYRVSKVGDKQNSESLKRPVPQAAIFKIGSGGLAFLKSLVVFPSIGCDGSKYTAEATKPSVASAEYPKSEITEEFMMGSNAARDHAFGYAEMNMDACAPVEEAEYESLEKSAFEQRKDSEHKKAEMPASDRGFRPGMKAQWGMPMDPTRSTSLGAERQIVRGKRLETVQPVSIQIQAPNGRTEITMIESIGEHGYSTMQLRLVDSGFLVYFAKAIFLFFVLCGFYMLREKCAKYKWRFAFIVIGVGTLLVLFPGLETFAPLFNAAVYAVVLVVVPVYILSCFFGCIRKHCRKSPAGENPRECASTAETSAKPAAIASGVIALIAAGLFFGTTANAQETAPAPVDPDEIGKIMVRLIQGDDGKPAIPEDVVLVPYAKGDVPETRLPSAEHLTYPSQKILVSSKRYQELLEIVNPKKDDDKNKLGGGEKPPVPYSLAGAEYKAELKSNTEQKLQEDLSIEGTIRIELFEDDPVVVPLYVFSGVIESVALDGKKAELGFGGTLGEAAQQQGAMTNHAQTAMINQGLYEAPHGNLGEGTIYLLTLREKGLHELKWTVRYNVQRQGGWRFVNGRLPVAAATSVSLQLADPGDELRTGNILDQRKWTAKEANEKMETTLAHNGAFFWQWRSKVTEGDIDYNLKVESEAVFDVREDGYRLNWNLSLGFGGARHETFRLKLPKDYQIASIEGLNVRGWAPAEVQDDPDSQIIDVEFLKPADETEKVALVLWKNGEFKDGEKIDSVVPPVIVANAALHRGRITIRKSPLLDVQTTNRSGLEQTDLPNIPTNANYNNNYNNSNRNNNNSNNNTAANSRTPDMESPLGMNPLQAYRFASEAFKLGISVQPVKASKKATIRSIIKLSEFESRLESQLNLHSQNRPIYQAEIRLPENFKLTNVSVPVAFEHSQREHEGNQILSIYLAHGREGSLPVVIEGELNDPSRAGEELRPITAIDLPKLSFLDVAPEETETQFVVLADPGFDLATKDLQKCRANRENVSFSWVAPEQRTLARLSIVTDRTLDYSGSLSLTPRVADVTVSSISNISIKQQSVDETIVLNFTITRAGIRTVEFELPERMKDARIECPLLRQKTVSAKEGAISVRLELQEDVIGNLQVLVLDDRLLLPDIEYLAPIPKVMTGRTQRQYVVLENTRGLDELESKSTGVKPLSRQLKEWAELETFLGKFHGTAYVLNLDENGAAASPSLTFKTQKRETLKMTGARIGLAETRLVLGQGGAYRAEQIYHIDNKTEQYLDIKLPDKAEIWVARILTASEWKMREQQGSGEFGEPVKPSLSPADAIVDFLGPNEKAQIPVGTTDPRFVRIPLVKTEVGDADYVVRIIYAGELPPMKSLDNIKFPLIEPRKNIHIESSLVRLFLPDDFRYKFDGKLSPLEDSRAHQEVSKLKDSYNRQMYDRLRSTISSSKNDFERVRANISLNELYDENRSLRERTIEAGKSDVSGVDPGFYENSTLIIENFNSQRNGLAKNVVMQSGNNWRITPGSDAPARDSQGAGNSFDSGWLESNTLNRDATLAELSDVEESAATAADSAFGDFASDLPKQKEDSFTRQSRALKAGSDGKIVIEGKPEASKPAIPQLDTAMKRPAPQTKETAALDESLARKLGNSDVQEPAMYRNAQLADNRSKSQAETLAEYEQKAIMRQNSAYGVNGAFGNPMGNDSGMEGYAVLEQTGGGQTGANYRRTDALATNQPAPQTRAPVGAFGPAGSASGSGGYGAGGGRVAGERADRAYVTQTEDMPTDANRQTAQGTTVERTPGGIFPETPAMPPAPQQKLAGIAENQIAHAPLARRFASLDIEIPLSGKEYVFTTPRGEIELSARCIAENDISRYWQLFLAVVALAAIYGFARGCSVLHSRVKCR